MTVREQYIKPSLLRLNFTTDVSVCELTNCKTTSSSSGQCLATGSSSCETTACNSIGS